MREVFDQAWKTVNKIAFMLAPDLERLLDKECQVCTRSIHSVQPITAVYSKYGSMSRESYVEIGYCFGIGPIEEIVRKRRDKFIASYAASDNCFCQLFFKLINILTYLFTYLLTDLIGCWCFVQLINQMVLNNRRMYADLKSKLLLLDIDRQRRLQQDWKKGLDVLKQSYVDTAVNSFLYDTVDRLLIIVHQLSVISRH